MHADEVCTLFAPVIHVGFGFIIDTWTGEVTIMHEAEQIHQQTDVGFMTLSHAE